jgi:two-component system response regulator FixJ
LAAATGFKPGCVLLDIRLPGMDGLEVLAQLTQIRSDLSVIIVTAQGDVKTAVQAMKAGVSDFLEKPYSDHALLGAIEATFIKQFQIARDRDVADAVRRVASLSPRERDVLDGLMAGRPNKLIAYGLGLSVRTVEIHRARMMDRLGVRQLSEAIRLGVIARLTPG